MAKDKQFEAEYKLEYKRRLDIRINKRKFNKAERNRRYGIGRKHAICDRCGNMMSWCSICECWSRTCCEDWGTCLCS